MLNLPNYPVYIDDNGAVIIVSCGIGDGKEFGTFRRKKSGSLQRIKTMPMIASFPWAMSDLHVYAKKKGWKQAFVKDECPECPCYKVDGCSSCELITVSAFRNGCNEYPEYCIAEDCVLAKIAAKEIKEYERLVAKYACSPVDLAHEG